MTLSIPQNKFYFVNGIMNEPEYGEQIAQIIKKIVPVQVECISNYATPTDRVVRDIALLILGIGFLAYGLIQEIQKKADLNSRLSSVLGFAALCATYHDYNNIQKDKNMIAADLRDRISTLLKENQSNTANLILHSQGADVGYRALQGLEKYKNRIRTITLGGMVTIPDAMCAQVANYEFTNDWVSKILASLFKTITQIQDQQPRRIIDLPQSGVASHAVEAYLKENAVQKKIQEFFKNNN